MSMSGGELKVLLALDKLADVIPAYRSVHGAFRVISGDGPTLEYTIFSNNIPGTDFTLDHPDVGVVSISDVNNVYRFDQPNVALFLSPTLDIRSNLSFREFAPEKIFISSVGITDTNPNDAGFGYNWDPSFNAYIHFELRIYPAV